MGAPTESVAEPPNPQSGRPTSRAQRGTATRDNPVTPHPASSPATIADWIRATEATTRRYTRLLGCPEHLADDLIQEAYLAALKKEAFLLPRAASTAWLRTAVRHLWQYQHRSAARRPGSISLDDVDELWARHEQGRQGGQYADALRQCLDTLPTRERAAIDLRYGDDLDPPSVGRHLGLLPEGAKTLLRRARGRLRACIHRRLSLPTPNAHPRNDS